MLDCVQSGHTDYTSSGFGGSVPLRYCSRVVSAFPGGSSCLLPFTYTIGCVASLVAGIGSAEYCYVCASSGKRSRC